MSDPDVVLLLVTIVAAGISATEYFYDRRTEWRAAWWALGAWASSAALTFLGLMAVIKVFHG
jgi:hypothetical protein